MLQIWLGAVQRQSTSPPQSAAAQARCGLHARPGAAGLQLLLLQYLFLTPEQAICRLADSGSQAVPSASSRFLVDKGQYVDLMDGRPEAGLPLPALNAVFRRFQSRATSGEPSEADLQFAGRLAACSSQV